MQITKYLKIELKRIRIKARDIEPDRDGKESYEMFKAEIKCLRDLIIKYKKSKKKRLSSFTYLFIELERTTAKVISLEGSNQILACEMYKAEQSKLAKLLINNKKQSNGK